MTGGEIPNLSAAEMGERYAEMGQIKVKVSRKKTMCKKDPKPRSRLFRAQQEIPEKALKGKAIDLSTQ